MKRLLHAIGLALGLSGLLGGLSACGGQSGSVTLSVFAASSLTDVMAELGTRYTQLHKDVSIKPAFAGSQELDRLVKEGQRSADVLVTADEASMDTMTRYVRKRRIVTRNSMTIAVAPGNPLHIKDVSGLTNPAVRVVLAAPNNPAGRYAQQIFAKAGVTVIPRNTEIDARTVLTQVRTGQADAGIVYVTDVQSAGAAASEVSIPPAQNILAAYPAAVLKRSHAGTASQTFVTWLASPEAQSIFAKYGFAPS